MNTKNLGKDKQSAYNSVRYDASEAVKLKTDLIRLREEIEQADLDDEERRNSQETARQRDEPSQYGSQSVYEDGNETMISPQIINKQKNEASIHHTF